MNTENKRCGTCRWYTPRDNAEIDCCVSINDAHGFHGYCTQYAPILIQPPILHVREWKGDPHLNNLCRVLKNFKCGYYEPDRAKL